MATSFTTEITDFGDDSYYAWLAENGEGEGGNGDLGGFATTPTMSSYSYVAQTPATGQGGTVAPLMAGSKWNSVDSGTAKTVVTYSFVNPGASTFSYGSMAAFSTGISGFSEADKATTREVLAQIAAVCNIEFVEVPDDSTQCGVVRYGYSPQPNAMNFSGYSFYPSTSAIGGDVWIGSNQAQAVWDFYRPDLILHETLHALGLKHPFSGGATLSAEQDIIPNTVMSYSPLAGGNAGYMTDYPTEPMAYDVAALQTLYGATSLNAGDTVYNLASADFQDGFRTLWDAGGHDTMSAASIAHGVTINLADGASSDIGVTVQASANVGGTQATTTYHGTVTVAQGAHIEDAIGSAFADTLTGSAADNRLQGNGGNDRINGGDGIDTAVYSGAAAAYTVVHNAAAFTVTGLGDGSDILTGIERVQFADRKVAFDLDGHAGDAVEVLGAVFGAQAATNPQFVGQALALLDGGMSMESLMQMALDLRLGHGAGNVAVVDLLYSNVMGQSPDAATLASFTGMIDHGFATQASLGVMAAETMVNQHNVDLVGLAAHGVVYA